MAGYTTRAGRTFLSPTLGSTVDRTSGRISPGRYRHSLKIYIHRHMVKDHRLEVDIQETLPGIKEATRLFFKVTLSPAEARKVTPGKRILATLDYHLRPKPDPVLGIRAVIDKVTIH